MSDKNSRTLTLLTVLAFLYDSLILLFWPQLFFQRFTNQFRIVEIIAGGFLFLLSSIFLLREWFAANWFSKYGLTLIGGVFLFCLASFHWLNQNLVTSLLLFGLVFATIISSFLLKSEKRKLLSTSLFGIAYLLAGLAAIWIILLQYQVPRNLIIPYLAQFVLFVISLILNFSLIFIEPGSHARKIFQILIAIPWFFFTLLLSLKFCDPSCSNNRCFHWDEPNIAQFDRIHKFKNVKIGEDGVYNSFHDLDLAVNSSFG